MENKYYFLKSSMNETDGMCKKKERKLNSVHLIFGTVRQWPEKLALFPTWPVIGTGFSTK